MFSRHVDEVPIIDESGVLQIQSENFFSNSLISSGKVTDKYQERQEPFLIERGFEELLHDLEAIALIFFYQLPQFKHPDCQEKIAFAILFGPGLEKSLQDSGSILVSKLPESSPDLLQGHFCSACDISACNGPSSHETMVVRLPPPKTAGRIMRVSFNSSPPLFRHRPAESKPVGGSPGFHPVLTRISNSYSNPMSSPGRSIQLFHGSIV